MSWRSLARQAIGGVAVLAAAAAMAAQGAPASHGAAAVDQQRLVAADKDAANWLTVGHGASEQRFSPLTQINDQNVGRLGLAWYADLDTYRGVEATPLVIDGVIYNVSAWDITTAYDGATGKVLWTYDPKIPVSYARIACCGPVSRGLAAWHGKVIIGALDGRLIALDAKTGKVAWTADTIVDKGQPLSITGAPRIAGGKVVVGNSGGDFGARGYMSAYDAATGKFAWRFWIVPGKPGVKDHAASDPVMPMAARTWTGEWWKYGGGGNDWDGLVYDAGQNLVIFGTGNGSPHPMKFRSPKGGDNLFLCSLVAVDARTGRYRWHYQEIPAEEWDYDCTNPPILADLKLHGRLTPVVMHAPKDGIFYVVDRRTGKLLSAENYVPSTWASGVDMKTGRPKVYPDALPQVKPHIQTPGFGGAHNWNPMAFSPLTGLVYIPAQEQYMVDSVLPDGEFKFQLGRTTIGAGYSNDPELRKQLNAEAAAKEKGYLLAWDPVHQREAFRVLHPHAGSSGTMATAGNLLVQGTISKTLAIYRADNGKLLWEMPIGTVPSAGAATYLVGGKQYIAINAGWNSAIVQGLDEGGVQFSFSPARLMVFALDAKGVSLPPAPPTSTIPPPPSEEPPLAKVQEGAGLYAQNCSTCHGRNAAGGVKDLRHMTAETHAAFFDIVLGGKLKDQGMEPFADRLTHDQAEAIHDYLISRAQEDWQPDFTHPPARK